MLKTLTFIVFIFCAVMRRRQPGPLWTAGLLGTFVLFVILTLAPSKKDQFVRQYDRVYDVSGRELGRLAAALKPEGPIAVVMEHDARVNQERLGGLQRELRRHGLSVQTVIIIPTSPEQPGFPSAIFEEKIKSRGYAAVISFYGLPEVSAPNANEWPLLLAYFPYGAPGAGPWREAGILRGGLEPNPDFAQSDMNKITDEALLRNHYRVLEMRD